jgi:succinate dehydrogenase hydrophobic anchor subunit
VALILVLRRCIIRLLLKSMHEFIGVRILLSEYIIRDRLHLLPPRQVRVVGTVVKATS